MSNPTETRTWPELAIGLFDKLTERNAEIAYDFNNFELAVPSSTKGDAESALWKIQGTLKITTNVGG